MKKKVLLIIALIMIISTIIRTMIVGYSFVNFSDEMIKNQTFLIKDLLNEVNYNKKIEEIIKSSQHINKIKIEKNQHLTDFKITYNFKKQTMTSCLPINQNEVLVIEFEGDIYFEKIINSMINIIIIALISLIVIILIVNYYLTPYLEILEKIQKITKNILKGNFENKIDIKVKGEAKEFVDSFNTFLSKLKESFGVIEEKYTSLIEKERSNDPLNDAKETIEQLANIFKFKNMIEEDNSSKEIFNRLTDVLLQFNIKNFALIGIDNSEKNSFEIYSKGEICCNILKNHENCRAYRLKKIINSIEFPNICSLHTCKNNYICIPFSASGNFTGILKINIITEEEKNNIYKNLPYIKAYLNEVSAIIEAKYTLELLHNQTIKDPMTNLFNRRHLENILPMIIATAQRRSEKVGFIMIDMDYFKKVNDTYGHKAGDIVLKTLANILINTVRQSDIVIRYGGEEFLVILQNIKNSKDVFDIAEKIRKNVENTKINIEEATIQKTVSLGISIFPENCSQGWECIKFADMALYKAKESGRNKTVIFSNEMKNKYEEN